MHLHTSVVVSNTPQSYANSHNVLVRRVLRASALCEASGYEILPSQIELVGKRHLSERPPFPFVASTDKQIVGQNHLNTSHAGSGREMPIIVDEDDRPSNNNKSNIMKLQAKIREIVEVYFFCLRAMYILVHS